MKIFFFQYKFQFGLNEKSLFILHQFTLTSLQRVTTMCGALGVAGPNAVSHVALVNESDRADAIT